MDVLSDFVMGYISISRVFLRWGPTVRVREDDDDGFRVKLWTFKDFTLRKIVHVYPSWAKPTYS